LTQHFGDLNLIRNRQNLDFINNGNQYFLQVMPFKDSRGLNWLIVVVVPEADFMAHIDANMYYTIVLYLVALIVTILVGFLTAKWIIQPLLQLNTTAKALAKSEWQLTDEVERQDEVGELAKSFNRLTKQLRNSFTTLETKNAELQHLDQLKDEFLANTSHELRTPLNGMIGIAESLIDGVTGKLSAGTGDKLSMIVASGRRLSNLINDILDFSKQKHKKIELQVEPLDMQKITETVLKLCQPLIGDKQLQLINAIHPDIPLANADKNRVQQILYNLIGNAIKFTESGHVKIAVKVDNEGGPKKEENLNGKLEITISDTGIGIPTDQTTQIFELFGQKNGSSAIQPNAAGGLGLTVTKQLVALHGGEIWVKSVIGVGSSFTFTLPINDEFSVPGSTKEGQIAPIGTELLVDSALQKVLPSDLPVSLSKDLPPAMLQPQGLLPESETFTILIVDDEPVNLHVLTNHLSRHNYTIVEASSGFETLDIINKGETPDLILLDIMMPKMTGYEVTRKIRETWEANKLPILLLTAKNQITDLVKGFEAGANDYLLKPISKHELLARIKTHLHIVQLHRKLEEYSYILEQKVKERTKKLAESEAILADAQRMSLLGSWIWDIKTNTVIRSAQDCRNFKQEPNSHTPTYEAFIENIHPADKDIFRTMVEKKVEEGHTAEFEFRAIWPNDQIRTMRSRTELDFDESGKPFRMKGFTQDITERKEAEIKLQEAKQAAEDALQQLKSAQEQLVEAAKMAELGNLVAGVAHEINTPVGIGVSAASKLDTLTKDLTDLYKEHKMKRADLDKYLESTQKGSELILKNLTRAAELVHSFKQVAVDQAGEQKRTFEIKEYLQEILTTLRPEFKRTKLQISIVCEEEIILSSYPGSFAQIITNFIMNSMIHGFALLPENDKEEWKIKIVASTSPSNEVEKNLILRYSDNGKGIPADTINNIFDPFFTTNRQGGGSGLGLHIVYNLVTHKLKGTIHCESVEGEGTTFTVSIPMSV
jgi:signal transduction histidine kinase/CheY-like chemotaxis protein